MSKKICSIYGCNRPVVARGYCNPHYRRSLKGASEREMKLPIRRYSTNHGDICTEPNCSEPYFTSGFCKHHYGKTMRKKNRHKLNARKRAKRKENRDEINARIRKRYAEDADFRERKLISARKSKAMAKRKAFKKIFQE